MDHLWANYPHAMLRTSGEDVGLPAGQMGNSEVGSYSICGAGFVVYQWLTRMDLAIANGEFVANPVLNAAIDRILLNGQTLHLLGLVSDGGVHAHLRHLVALLRLAATRGVAADRVVVDVITDGRDTAPTAGEEYVAQLRTGDGGEPASVVSATVSGRYYAMDRDRRWDRTRLAYDAMVNGLGPTVPSAGDAITAAYAAGVTDEFIIPTVIDGDASARIKPGDSVIFFNFRADRGRQLSEALVSEQIYRVGSRATPAGAAPGHARTV